MFYNLMSLLTMLAFQSFEHRFSTEVLYPGAGGAATRQQGLALTHGGQNLPETVSRYFLAGLFLSHFVIK